MYWIVSIDYEYGFEFLPSGSSQAEGYWLDSLQSVCPSTCTKCTSPCQPNAQHCWCSTSQGGYYLYCWVIWMCRRFDLLFWHSRDWTRSFGGTFSHPLTPKRSFVALKLPILTEFDHFGPTFHFSLDLLGSNFQRPVAYPHRFSS